MERHVALGIASGIVFTVVIVAGAAVSAFPEGGAVLLAAVVDGLLAGLCIGALIGANFALAAIEKEKEELPHKADAKVAAAA